MSTLVLKSALELAAQKVRLFPVRANTKLPAIDDFSRKATNDPAEISKIFSFNGLNSGIACGRVDDGLYLVGFDIDKKADKNGYDTLEQLAILGQEFPDTWSQKTPSGGEHRLYWSRVAIRQGVDVCGRGIDLRSDGGYLVGPGSSIGDRYYTPLLSGPIQMFPEWAVKLYAKTTPKVVSIHQKDNIKIEDQFLAMKRGKEWLENLPPVEEGRRNHEGYAAACYLKDLGVDQGNALDLMLGSWKSDPMLPMEELAAVINSAFKYSMNVPGFLAPEKNFEIVKPKKEPGIKHPFDELNEDHFYVASNGVSRVCWETNIDGEPHLERFPVHIFHEKYAAKEMLIGKRPEAVTKLWIKDKNRRDYDQILFRPEPKVDSRIYNLWKGFAVDPVPRGATMPSEKAHNAAGAFLEHCKENICGNDVKLFDWLMAFFAHIFQKPEEKPQVALVLQGGKGAGKTSIMAILKSMIGRRHGIIISKKDLAVGSFNSIMEDKLLVVLDEAFWSGDKAIEGILKDMITNPSRTIHHKQEKPYDTKVYDRIVIIGNEDWLVPASGDERRFAVFKVGDKRQQDQQFFKDMIEGLETHGGNRLLMRYFLDYDLSKFNINSAPATKGLAEQKENSLPAFEAWWLECLKHKKIFGSGTDDWIDKMSVREFQDSFKSQVDKEGSGIYRLKRALLGRAFKKICPSAEGKSLRIGNKVEHGYSFPVIEVARAEWDKYMRHTTDWNE